MTAPLGSRPTFCDGISRRNFLQIGGMAAGGLALPQLLAAQAQAGTSRSHKAVIMVFLSGGPPHQDMFDLKMDAPAEIRGEFQPISTKVPGIQICEHLPRMAARWREPGLAVSRRPSRAKASPLAVDSGASSRSCTGRRRGALRCRPASG